MTKSTEQNMINLFETMQEAETSKKDDALYNKLALEEEQKNAANIYARLQEEIQGEQEKIQYKDISQYDTGLDNDEKTNLLIEKKNNEPRQEKIKLLKRYYKKDKLYVGHLILQYSEEAQRDIYFHEDGSLKNYIFDPESVHDIALVNVDDKNYSEERNAWLFHKKGGSIAVSRVIDMENRSVIHVETKYDKSREELQGILDSFLQKALLRNRSQEGLHSIIRSIQEKQNDIREYDSNSSFAVQGCAGSGKTMVLLHRLRYLLYNNLLDNDQYYFLIPSERFRSFIVGISNEFRIRSSNIYTYMEYYRSNVPHDKKDETEESDERVFPSEYLEEVYSFSFLANCLCEVFIDFKEQSDFLLAKSESIVNRMIEEEQKRYEEQVASEYGQALSALKEALLPFDGLVDIKEALETSAETLQEKLDDFITQARKDFEKREEASKQLKNLEKRVREQLKDSEDLRRLEVEIQSEEERLANSSVFMRFAHQRKLAQLRERVGQISRQKISEIEEQEKRRIKEIDSQLKQKYKNMPFGDLVALSQTAKSAANRFGSVQAKSRTLSDKEIEEQFARILRPLNNYIEVSASIVDYIINHDSIVKDIIFSAEKLEKICETAINLYKTMAVIDEEIKTKGAFFNCDAGIDLRKKLSKIAFKKCKEYTKSKFHYIPNKNYKHYWFLRFAFHSIFINEVNRKRGYFFVDEAQDLSEAELELIYNFNTVIHAGKPTYPIMELFGDIHQTIASPCISRWEELSFINRVFELDENFRNTNQIISFCNDRLPFSMKKIGIDLDEVAEYPSIEDMAAKEGEICRGNVTFIVKDTTAAEDLWETIDIYQDAMNGRYEVYTIREVKGLEFKEVVVFERGMTVNEKYIAYTRALNRLIVVADLPHILEEDISINQEDNAEE